jgi:imidazolonepropionase-like amidohydrolase
VHAIRARHAFDGESFLPGGVTVLIEGGALLGVESYGFEVPDRCVVSEHDGTLLPGLIDAHTHLVTDSGDSALDRVAGYTTHQIEEVVTRALADQLAAGVTTVRDLGDRRYCVLERRDRQRSTPVNEPTIVASGPPVTSTGGHCHFLGGEVSGPESIVGAVAERVERGVDIIKVMASGGVNTPGTDVMATQFTTAELQVEQALTVGVDGIEHCSCVTDRGYGQVGEQTLSALARSGIAVCPTLGVDQQLMTVPPPAIQAMMDRMGVTAQEFLQTRWDFVGRLHTAGVRLVSGADSGIGAAKRHGVLPYAVCELVAAGLSIPDALATATSGAAQACGVGARKGRLAPRRDADLLVLDGDLQADVTALHRPQSVLLRGHVVSL